MLYRHVSLLLVAFHLGIQHLLVVLKMSFHLLGRLLDSSFRFFSQNRIPTLHLDILVSIHELGVNQLQQLLPLRLQQLLSCIASNRHRHRWG